MAINVAINGYGRIGRMTLRALYESNRTAEINIVAINDLADAESNVFLTKRDTAHGNFNAEVSLDGDHMVVNGDRIRVCNERNPADLPWKELDVDVVLECTGVFRTREACMAHVQAGAKKVVISAPARGEIDATVVYGVNHQILKSSDQIISNASCTTNCLAPLVKPLHEKIGVEQGLMVTIHAYTNDQVLTDVFHKDIRRARSATMSMIPTKTGAAAALGLVLPELKGRFDGYSMRVPTINVSMVDLTFTPKRSTTIEEINQIIKTAAEGELKGVLAYTEEPLVSIDYNHTAVSSTYDATLTRVSGNLVKVCAWYDNEWGFSCRMLDTVLALVNA